MIDIFHSVYIAGQVVKGQLQMYPNDKIDGQEKVSNSKAALIYAALDDYPEIYQVNDSPFLFPQYLPKIKDL